MRHKEDGIVLVFLKGPRSLDNSCACGNWQTSQQQSEHSEILMGISGNNDLRATEERLKIILIRARNISNQATEQQYWVFQLRHEQSSGVSHHLSIARNRSRLK